MVARSAGIEALDLDVSFPPALDAYGQRDGPDIAKEKADTIVAAFQSGLLGATLRCVS